MTERKPAKRTLHYVTGRTLRLTLTDLKVGETITMKVQKSRKPDGTKRNGRRHIVLSVDNDRLVIVDKCREIESNSG